MTCLYALTTLSLLLTGCPTPTDPSPEPDAGAPVDAGPAEATFCELQGLSERAFDATAPSAFQRRQPAGDFTVSLPFDETFTLSERWTGCESYIFLPHDLPLSQSNPASLFTTDLAQLIENSPRNVHYFFVARGRVDAVASNAIRTLKSNIETLLETMSDEDYDHWMDHLHVVRGGTNDIDGLVGSMFSSAVGARGWAIDRFQRIRGIGGLADVNARTNAEGGRRRAFPRLGAQTDPRRTRQERLDAETPPRSRSSTARSKSSTPTVRWCSDAATMAGFATMEFDILMECPDRDRAEFGNCGEWDYLGHVWLRDAADENWLEMGRIITTYHRESRWIMDASWALAWLQDGGERTIRYEWAPWNKQPTGITLLFGVEPQGTCPRARTDLLGRRQQQLQPARVRHRHRSGERHPDQARRRDHRTRDGHAELRRVLRPLTPLHAR